MDTREIMTALVAGKKVGELPYGYMYLNIDGSLTCEIWDHEFENDMEFIYYMLELANCVVLPEDGP